MSTAALWDDEDDRVQEIWSEIINGFVEENDVLSKLKINDDTLEQMDDSDLEPRLNDYLVANAVKLSKYASNFLKELMGGQSDEQITDAQTVGVALCVARLPDFESDFPEKLFDNYSPNLRSTAHTACTRMLSEPSLDGDRKAVILRQQGLFKKPSGAKASAS